MRRLPGRFVVVVALMAASACGGSSDDTESAATAPVGSDSAATSIAVTTTTAATTSTAEPTTTEATMPDTSVPTTTAAPVDPRAALIRRITDEFGDADLAASVVGTLDDTTIGVLDQFADGDLLGSPALSYAPSTAPADAVDSLWIFAYGYRFTADALAQGVDTSGGVPPMDALEPGPTNEALARLAAAFVTEHPVPIVAQWEVAQVLAELGVADVISVEPDMAADGTITYLSTAGVAAKGLRLAAEAGVTVGHAGVLCFADHAVRCLMTARAGGMTADVPAGLELPAAYDTESGQPWTRNRDAWIPVDLLGRTAIA